MTNPASASERGIPSGSVREFTLGASEVTAKQKGAVTQLSHPQFGVTYLVDVTDRDDPTRHEQGELLKEEDIVRNCVGIDKEVIKNHYADNNGVVCLVTDQLDHNGEVRAYVGVMMSDPNDEEGREITTHILGSAGFQRGSFYVPFSFDSDLVSTYMAEEIMNATKDSPDKKLFADFQKLLN